MVQRTADLLVNIAHSREFKESRERSKCEHANGFGSTSTSQSRQRKRYYLRFSSAAPGELSLLRKKDQVQGRWTSQRPSGAEAHIASLLERSIRR